MVDNFKNLSIISSMDIIKFYKAKYPSGSVTDKPFTAIQSSEVSQECHAAFLTHGGLPETCARLLVELWNHNTSGYLYWIE